jgi:toxin YoeB
VRGSALPPKTERLLVFNSRFIEDLTHWVRVKSRAALRVLALVDAINQDPTGGIGKPERLRSLPHAWSRRITQEHRLVYMVRGERIDFLQARYHY